MTWCHKFSVLLTSLAFGLMMVSCSGSGDQQQFEEQIWQQGQFDDDSSNEQGYYEQGDEQGDDFANLNYNNLEALENEVENLDNLANIDASQDDLMAILNEVNNDGENWNWGGNSLFNNNEQPANFASGDYQNIDNNYQNIGTGTQDNYVDLAGSNNFSNVGNTMVAGNLPEMGTKMAYTVERGDTLGTIASKIFGTSAKWRELAQTSNFADPNRIYPGDLVYYQLNEQSQNFAANYENQGRGMVVVKSGDSLRNIAKQVYGNTDAWKTLWRLNDSIDNPDNIQAGMTLYFTQGSMHHAKVEKQPTKVTKFKVAGSKNQAIKFKA